MILAGSLQYQLLALQTERTLSQLIKPRTLKGFRDFLPEVMMPRERIMDIAKTVYRRYGFSPIDTPVLEYLEILTGKGSDETDKQMYRFEDHGGRSVGMRFDLTIPLARFAAQHINSLGTPFKRYHIAPVWRGESPQAGRYREFMQCDFDTIGTQSVVADIETALVIHDLISEIGIQNFTIKINNRQVLTGLLEKLELVEQTVPVLRALDKLEKIGREKVMAEMELAAGVTASQANQVLQLAEIDGSLDEMLLAAETLVAGNAAGQEGIERLRQIVASLQQCGIPSERYTVDLSIARGLDYYTGVIFETTLDDLPSIGSICSGGRYDNLAALYTKQHLPGIGASLGLDRLLAAMETLEMLPKVRTPAKVLMVFFDKSAAADYLQLARIIRVAGIGVEMYPDAKKLGVQLKYADARGFELAIIAGSQELEAGTCQIKHLATKSSTEVKWRDDPSQLLVTLREQLSSDD